MKKRLGTIPKGLEWISQDIDSKVATAMKIQDEEISSAKQGLSSELTRATFIINQDYLEKIKAYAYWERLQIKDVLDDMCKQFFSDKKVRSIPEKNNK